MNFLGPRPGAAHGEARNPLRNFCSTKPSGALAVFDYLYVAG